MLTVLETERYRRDTDLSHQTRNTNQSTSSTKSLSVYYNWSALWADFLPTQLRCLTNSLFRSITLTMHNISLLVFFFSLIIFWLCRDFLTGAPKARSFTLILAMLPHHNQTNNSEWERKFPSCLDWWRDNTGETPHSCSHSPNSPNSPKPPGLFSQRQFWGLGGQISKPVTSAFNLRQLVILQEHWNYQFSIASREILMAILLNVNLWC